MTIARSFDGPRSLDAARGLRAVGRPDPFASAVELLRVWRFRQRHRSELRRLLKVGPHMIDDIGLRLKQATDEARKPFWQA